MLTGHVRMDGYTLIASATRKYETNNLVDVYETGVEAGIAWLEPKKREAIQISIWYQHLDTHTIGGLAFGVAPTSLIKH